MLEERKKSLSNKYVQIQMQQYQNRNDEDEELDYIEDKIH